MVMPGSVAVVTGANKGIGFHIASQVHFVDIERRFLEFEAQRKLFDVLACSGSKETCAVPRQLVSSGLFTAVVLGCRDTALGNEAVKQIG